MRLSKTVIFMTSAWAVLLLAGLILTSGHPAASNETKISRHVAAAEDDYVRCLKLRYGFGHQGGTSLAQMTGACRQKSNLARAALIRAGFPVPRADGKIAALPRRYNADAHVLRIVGRRPFDQPMGFCPKMGLPFGSGTL